MVREDKNTYYFYYDDPNVSCFNKNTNCNIQIYNFSFIEIVMNLSLL